MSKLVEMLKDVYPFGCKTDLVTLTEEEFAKLEKAAKKLEGEVFRLFKPAADTAKVEDKKVETPKADAKPADKPADKPAADTAK